MNLMQKLTQHREALAKGQTITAAALAEKRDLTPAEAAEVDHALATLKALDADPEFKAHVLAVKASNDEQAAVWAQVNQPTGAKADGPQFLQLKTSPAKLREALGLKAGGRIDSKALISGVVSLPVDTDAGPIVTASRPVASLLAVIPAEEVDSPPYYGYLAQGPRTNSAAPVAAGGLKPTTAMSLSRKQGRLRVIAHLSEPVDRFLLEDFQSLNQFVSDELAVGVRDALVAQILTGDGTGEHFTGLSNLSGVLAQAFSVDAITSVRAGLTQQEALGNVPSAIVMNAAAWAGIETARTTSDAFIMSPAGGPVDATARKLFGVPVVVVPTMAANTAYIITEGALVIKHDGAGVRIDWGTLDDSFARNQVLGRAEGRFDLAALRPAGIVEVALA